MKNCQVVTSAGKEGNLVFLYATSSNINGAIAAENAMEVPPKIQNMNYYMLEQFHF